MVKPMKCSRALLLGRLSFDQKDQQLEASGDRGPAVSETTAQDGEPRLEVADC